jgi:hypothetical protein
MWLGISAEMHLCIPGKFGLENCAQPGSSILGGHKDSCCCCCCCCCCCRNCIYQKGWRPADGICAKIIAQARHHHQSRGVQKHKGSLAENFVDLLAATVEQNAKCNQIIAGARRAATVSEKKSIFVIFACVYYTALL